MKKVYGKRFVSIVIFCVLFAIIVSDLSSVLVIKREDGVLTMKNFYLQPKNSCDVLILGSSHAGVNLDVEVFWKEQGIPAYALWGSVQPFWNSYHFLLEALKYQTPKVVALDVYAASFPFDYSDDARQETNTVGMRTGWNKWEAIKVSAPENRWLDLLLGFPLYHTRIGELTEKDFQYFPWDDSQVSDKGTSVRYGNLQRDLGEPEKITEVRQMHEKQECYLRKIIELCRGENLPLLLVKTTSADREYEQPFYNSVQLIAEEYGVPFVNMNLMDEILNISSDDIWTDGGHLNTAGSRKISGWLAAYLKEAYGLADHRGDPYYASWEEFSQSKEKEYLTMITSASDYFQELARSDHAVAVIEHLAEQLPDSGAAIVKEIQKLGFPLTDSADGSISVLTKPESAQVIGSSSEGKFRLCLADGQETGISVRNGALWVKEEKIREIQQNDMMILVFDPQSGEILDMVSFPEPENDTLVRIMKQ